MKYYALTLFTSLCLLSTVAHAGSCYSQAEAEAEQGIRIHSELMVIGLNCQAIGARHGLNLYSDYRTFTARHADVFGGYEETLLEYFKKRGDSKPVRSLNTLRTDFANKISNDAAEIRPDIFCAKYAPRIEQAKSMNNSDVRQWAGTFHTSHPVSKPLCKG